MYPAGYRFELNENSQQSVGLRVWVPTLGQSLSGPTDYCGACPLGTAGSGASFATDDFLGTVLAVDGSNNGYWEIPDSVPVQITGDQLTLSCWAKRNGNQNPAGAGMLIRKGGGSGSRRYGLYMRAGNEPRFPVNNTDFISGTATPNLTWVHIAGTYDGATRRIYQDGVQTDTNSFSGNISDDGTPLRIGAHQDSGRYFDGWLADMRVYDRCLSPEEIWAIYSPETRMELYRRPDRVYFVPGAGGPVQFAIGLTAQHQLALAPMATTPLASTINAQLDLNVSPVGQGVSEQTIGVQQQLAPDGVATTPLSSAMNVQHAIAIAPVAIADAIITVATQLDIDVALLAGVKRITISLDAAAGLANDLISTAQGGVTVATQAGFTVDGVSTAQAAIQLLADAGFSVVPTATTPSNITLAVDTTFATKRFGQLVAALAVASTIQADGAATAGVTVSLQTTADGLAGVVGIAQQLVSLGVIETVTVDGETVVLTIPPAERLFEVLKAERVFEVEKHERIFEV